LKGFVRPIVSLKLEYTFDNILNCRFV